MYEINLSTPAAVHFIGIGGISMSGLAQVLLDKGFAVSGSDTRPSLLTRSLEEKGAAVSDERLADTARLFRALSYRRAPRPMKGARRTLDELRRRGAKLYLLSNAQSCFTVPELQLLGLADAFDGIFLSSDFGCRKPSPAFFRAALARAGASPESSLMVGNDPDADIRGADAVGMVSRYIHSPQSPPRGAPLPGSCREIASLTDLLK